MTTGVAVRQRYPDNTKQLKVLRTYKEYAQFEATLTDITHVENGERNIAKRIDELQYESTKTLEVLKTKPPVRIPEMRAAEKEGQGEALIGKGRRGS
jgi:hypothetical protein